MLGPIGSEVMAVFRLLSPHEIDAYITEEDNSVVRIEGTRTATGEELPHDSSKQFFSRNESGGEIDAPEDEDIDVNKPAKIIPLHAYQDSSDSERVQQNRDLDRRSPKSREKDSSLSSLGILSASQIKAQEKARLESEKSQEDSVTVFLLKEREKMRKSKKRMTEQSAIKVYQHNAAVDLNIEDSFDEDGEPISNSDMRGILVNKKQY
ncbi:MAG: hypothetical protein CME65_11805 [Halobacteriovoraceae bacterium]|nr:hypothetical protein [Halobacteriovoraceae bacterium]|tara:strand:- start:9990 stop:10613 length:624 start_codon:yes stop_codon:yes gene_type:complete